MHMVAAQQTIRERHAELFPNADELTKKNAQLLAVLDSFMTDFDETEMKQTGEHLMKYLAETRGSNRSLENR